MKNTVLLCTFTNKESLEESLTKIRNTYDLAMGAIYILQNADDLDQLILTYNVIGEYKTPLDSSDYTISVHRKKKTNTIYTINAVNKLIMEETGKYDPKYPLDWDKLQNMVMVTAYGKLKKINTIIYDVIKIK